MEKQEQSSRPGTEQMSEAVRIVLDQVAQIYDLRMQVIQLKGQFVLAQTQIKTLEAEKAELLARIKLYEETVPGIEEMQPGDEKTN